MTARPQTRPPITHEARFALPQKGEAGRPITNPRHSRLCRGPGRPRFDAPAEELCVIDTVAQDDVAAGRELARTSPCDLMRKLSLSRLEDEPEVPASSYHNRRAGGSKNAPAAMLTHRRQVSVTVISEPSQRCCVEAVYLDLARRVVIRCRFHRARAGGLQARTRVPKRHLPNEGR